MSETQPSGKDEIEPPAPEQRRIMYVPWHSDNAGDFKPFQAFMNWSKHASGKNYEWYHVDHLPYLPFNFKGPTDHITIYIRGHGRSGSDRLSPTNQESNIDVKPEGLFEDLVEGGLRKDFTGRIKFYSCESGLGGAAAFACKCASLFRAHGFTRARFYGYVGTMTGGYGEYQGEWHKFTVPGDERARTLRREVAFDTKNEAYIAVI